MSWKVLNKSSKCTNYVCWAYQNGLQAKNPKKLKRVLENQSQNLILVFLIVHFCQHKSVLIECWDRPELRFQRHAFGWKESCWTTWIVLWLRGATSCSLSWFLRHWVPLQGFVQQSVTPLFFWILWWTANNKKQPGLILSFQDTIFLGIDWCTVQPGRETSHVFHLPYWSMFNLQLKQTSHQEQKQHKSTPHDQLRFHLNDNANKKHLDSDIQKANNHLHCNEWSVIQMKFFAYPSLKEDSTG